MTDPDYDTDEVDKPLEFEPEKELEPILMEVLEFLARPRSILFTVRPGGFGALMIEDFSCRKIPQPWIKQLVKRAYIDQEKSSRGKLAAMGWIEYQLTYEGQQALNRSR